MVLGAPIGVTPGSVLFGGAGGVLAQDNANFFWDDANNRLGIGNAAPSDTLHITGTLRTTGNVGFGTTPAANAFFRSVPSAGQTTGAIQIGMVLQEIVDATCVTRGVGTYSRCDTDAAVFTCAEIRQYDADNSVLGAGSTITTQTGIHIRDQTRGGTNNYGVRSVVSAGAGKFNLFIDGTAINAVVANLRVGSATAPVQMLDVSGTIGATDKIFPGTDAAAAQTVAGIYAGTGVPNNANGNNGDFYFRSDGTVAGNTVQYHKEAGAWVAYT